MQGKQHLAGLEYTPCRLSLCLVPVCIGASTIALRSPPPGWTCLIRLLLSLSIAPLTPASFSPTPAPTQAIASSDGLPQERLWAGPPGHASPLRQVRVWEGSKGREGGPCCSLPCALITQLVTSLRAYTHNFPPLHPFSARRTSPPTGFVLPAARHAALCKCVPLLSSPALNRS